MDELRVLEGVEQHGLGIPEQHGDRPGAHRDGADRGRGLGPHERLALLEEAGQTRGLRRVGHDQTRQLRLVVVEDVLIDRRHHVVGVLHPAAERLGLLRQIVVGEHHVGLVALVIVHHRRDRLGHVRAVLLDREAVERAGERGDDRIDRDPIGERAAVCGDDAVAIRELRAAALDVPDAVGLHVFRRQLGLVLHELGDRVADAAVVGALEPLDDLLHLIPGNREGHLVVLCLAEDAVAGAGQDHLRLVRPHGRDDDLGAVDAAAEGGGELAAALPERGLRQAHDLGGVGVDADQVRLERGAIERRH